MKVTPTKLPGVLIIEPRVFEDHRGCFLETYHRERYAAAGIDGHFVQDNYSRSQQGTLRGLHYQWRRPQAKLVWSSQGEVFDVAVDVRAGSPTLGQWVGVHLDGKSKRQVYVPAGYAHGFCVLSETAEVLYKCTDFYDPEGEAGVLWNDPALGIAWPSLATNLSPKDAALPYLANARLLSL